MNLQIAVHISPQVHTASYASGWISALEKKNVAVHRVNMLAPDALEQVHGCNGVMWHWFHTPDDKQAALKILPAIELGLGIPVFPDMHTCWHYDEKIAQHFLLESIQVPRVKSWVFWNLNDALNFLSSCAYPIVFKLSVGAGSANVVKIDTKKDAMTFARRMFQEGVFPYTMNEYEKKYTLKTKRDLINLIQRAIHGLKYTFIGKYPPLPGYFIPQKNYFYLQEFIPDNSHDIRITVIGNRAFGFIRYNREGDFRASGSGHIDHDPKKVPLDAVKLAHDISLKIKFQSMAYDFLLNSEKKPLVNEISYCYVSEAVYACPGFWDRDLQWHPGQVKPEDVHVDDFIKLISSRKKP